MFKNVPIHPRNLFQDSFIKHLLVPFIYLSEFESATFGQARQNYSYKNTSRIKEATQQQQITQITQNTIRKKMYVNLHD